MTTIRTRSSIRGTRLKAAAVAGLCLGGTALANPIPPAYLDFPVAPGTFVSHTRGPLLADDFVSAMNRRIVFVEWWGSESDASWWELTLYSNTDADVTLPDATRSAIPFVTPRWAYPVDDGIFYYGAEVDDPAWVLARGHSYWFGVASYSAGWTWALGSGDPELGGVQRESAVVSPDGAAWESLRPTTNFAFGLWPELVPEPGMVLLLGLGLTGIAMSRRRLARRGGAP
jgi:hypothetical protein